jgi:hypothetical protein
MSSESMAQLRAMTDLADVLYDFLPGTPHPYGDKGLSFPAAAKVAGVGAYWPGGSKKPAIIQLLRRTLEERRGNFCQLIVAIVKNAMVYRANKHPLTRAELDSMNDCVRRVGFKIPELWDESFLSSLLGSKAAAKTTVEARDLSAIRDQLISIERLDAQERGYALESFLKELFTSFDLSAGGAFRIVGEQIDGSFVLDAEPYLVEARWRGGPAPAAWLYEFAGKVERKAQWTRGLFVSYSGFSNEGLQAFSRAPTRIVCMDGLDLFEVVSGRVDLVALLRKKIERAAKTGDPFVSARELM